MVPRYFYRPETKVSGRFFIGVEHEYRFGDEEVQQKLDDMDGKFAYSAFKELYHSKGAYYLYIDKAHAIVLPERCFTQGAPPPSAALSPEKRGLK